MTSAAERVRLRPLVRRRAMANVLLVLLEAARHTAGRLVVAPFSPDAVSLFYFDVRTLVRQVDHFAFAVRDFGVLLACPEGWPFERAAAMSPVVLEPADWAHPNSNGREVCLDLAGVLPERVPALVYEQLRVGRFRLDHVVDPLAADFVRAHLGDFPADHRPLAPEIVP